MTFKKDDQILCALTQIFVCKIKSLLPTDKGVDPCAVMEINLMD